MGGGLVGGVVLAVLAVTGTLSYNYARVRGWRNPRVYAALGATLPLVALFVLVGLMHS